VNDNAPTFLDTPYTGAVLENASLGMTVMRVTAADKDEVTRKHISTYITANVVFSFSVVEFSGFLIGSKHKDHQLIILLFSL